MTISRTSELSRWGATVAEDLVELTTSFERGEPTIAGPFRPFPFRAAFLLERDAPFEVYVEQAQLFGTPVFFMAHFAGLHPIGESAMGDSFLASIYDGEIYRYRRAQRALMRERRCAADLLARPRLVRPRTRSDHDAGRLWERAEWLASFFAAGSEPVRSLLDEAPTARVYESERGVLHERPELLSYWLLAHLLLGNRTELDECVAIARESENAFVASLASFSRIVRARGSLGVLGTLTAKEVDDRLRKLAAAIPLRLRGVDHRGRRAASKKLAARLVEQARARGQDLEALMRAHLDDLDVIWAALDAIAEDDEAFAAELAWAKPFVTTKRGARLAPEVRARVRDPRFLSLFVALVRRRMVDGMDHFYELALAKVGECDDALARATLADDRSAA